MLYISEIVKAALAVIAEFPARLPPAAPQPAKNLFSTAGGSWFSGAT